MSEPAYKHPIHEVVFKHTLTVYEALDKDAEDAELHGETIRLFKGSVTVLFRSTSVSQTYYSRVMRSLERLGCITYLERGGRGRVTTIALHCPPTEEQFAELGDEALTRRVDVAILSQRVQKLEQLVGEVDIPQALLELERQIREVRGIGTQQT